MFSSKLWGNHHAIERIAVVHRSVRRVQGVLDAQ
jgi:hypothetical protein